MAFKDKKEQFNNSSRMKKAAIAGAAGGFILGGPLPIVGHITGALVGGIAGFVLGGKK